MTDVASYGVGGQQFHLCLFETCGMSICGPGSLLVSKERVIHSPVICLLLLFADGQICSAFRLKDAEGTSNDWKH